jgi:hypothetical protein
MLYYLVDTANDYSVTHFMSRKKLPCETRNESYDIIQLGTTIAGTRTSIVSVRFPNVLRTISSRYESLYPAERLDVL